MDFETTVRTDINLIVIKSILKKRHGPIVDLVLCKGECQQRNELHGDMKTLREFGIKGGPKDNAPTTTIYYNFKPADWEQPDPLLLS